MAAPNLANLSRPGAVAGRVPNMYRGQASRGHADEHRPERPILLAAGWTSTTVIGSSLRVAAPRSLLGIVDQVQFAW